ncbi:PEP-utilizing enzyme, partial [Pseudonocardia xishanensis]|uniref:PEP-utilizing enzyme n=1 Tax=Pseudonocardia xishanensis TaxID=630995 RepID=UPI0031EFDD19
AARTADTDGTGPTTSETTSYRDFHGIPHDLGTAVVVQSMVFGNLSQDSGSGVVFTRNPVSGERELFGEYLAASQGEDVVAGTRTPSPVAEALNPILLDELTETCARLEASHADVLDIEFTVEGSRLYFLQVRSAKRTPEAAVRIAADLLAEGRASLSGALSGVSLEQIRQVQRPGFDEAEVEEARRAGRLVTTGTGACPGQVSGRLVVDPDRAKEMAEQGEKVILARSITSPADLHGMIAAEGIVTATGGSTSHAAVVARALATPCVVGADEIVVDEHARTLRVGESSIAEGEHVSLDGATGELFAGAFATATQGAATAALSSLLDTARRAADSAVLGRVTVAADVAPVLAAGASGIVFPLDAALAAAGELGTLRLAVAERGRTGSDLHETVAALVEQAAAPVLAAAAGAEVVVRSIDLRSDDLAGPGEAEVIDGLERYLPLGVEGLLDAQLEGLARAAARAGDKAGVRLAVSHLDDVLEVAAVRRAVQQHGDLIRADAFVTSPRGMLGLSALARDQGGVWVDLPALQAATRAIPLHLLRAADPLDAYAARGLTSSDPRVTVDPAVARLFEVLSSRPPTSGASVDGALTVAVDLGTVVTADSAALLHALGVRRFAADAPEVRPLLLALGKAASAPDEP